jgi:hypothetical protein
VLKSVTWVALLSDAGKPRRPLGLQLRALAGSLVLGVNLEYMTALNSLVILA